MNEQRFWEYLLPALAPERPHSEETLVFLENWKGTWEKVCEGSIGRNSPTDTLGP